MLIVTLGISLESTKQKNAIIPAQNKARKKNVFLSTDKLFVRITRK